MSGVLLGGIRFTPLHYSALVKAKTVIVGECVADLRVGAEVLAGDVTDLGRELEGRDRREA